MMKDQDKINMEIIIGGEPIQLIVPFQDQELTRSMEYEINQFYSQWTHSFPKITEKGLLAMIVYRYALKFRQLTLEYQQAERKAEECLDMIGDPLENS